MERSNAVLSQSHQVPSPPMTASQAKYLKDLCAKAGREFDPSISKSEASRQINELNRRRAQQTE